MTTTVYFVRHCQPNFDNHEDSQRELSSKGLQDCQLVTHFFLNKVISQAYSSPFKRAYDTINDFCQTVNLPIIIKEDLRERKIADVWIKDFDDFSQKQWSDFTYKLADGESLKDVQARQLRILTEIIQENQQQSIIVGSHGTAISTLIHYFSPHFNYQDFQKLKTLMPFVLALTFEKTTCQAIHCYNLFNHEMTTFDVIKKDLT